MALVTMHAVVHVPVHTLMVPIGIGFVGVFMTTQAREDQIVLRIRMARVAGRGPTVRLREVGVVKHRSQPVRRAVARLARRRETRRRVIRVRRVVVVRLVAAHACRVGDAVVAVDVALCARDRCGVEARQRPSCRGVIELSVRPQKRVMASLASGRKARRNMVNWSLRAVVVGLMAGYTRGVRQMIVVVHVAQSALHGGVEASESPACSSMVELAVSPHNGVMAALAGRREARRNVVHRRLGAVVVRLMAGNAGGVRQMIVVIDMAKRARCARVPASQRKARRGVIELPVGPQYCVMAALAGRREVQSHVINRRLRAIVVGLVAAYASRIR